MNAPRRVMAGETGLPTPLPGAASVCAVAGKGRGVRAAYALSPGDVVEVASTIELTGAEALQMDETPLGPYYLEHPLDSQAGVVVLGLVSLVNHADRPNAAVEWLRDPDTGWFAVLRILRPVAAGEEITHRYQCPPWFEVVD
jgi:hypothetical protein